MGVFGAGRPSVRPTGLLVAFMAGLLFFASCQSAPSNLVSDSNSSGQRGVSAQCDQVGYNESERALVAHGPMLFVSYYGCLSEQNLISDECDMRFRFSPSTLEHSVSCYAEILEQVGSLESSAPEDYWRVSVTQSLMGSLRVGQDCATITEGCQHLANQITELAWSSGVRIVDGKQGAHPADFHVSYWTVYVSALISEPEIHIGPDYPPLTDFACLIVATLKQNFGLDEFAEQRFNAAERAWLAEACAARSRTSVSP